MHLEQLQTTTIEVQQSKGSDEYSQLFCFGQASCDQFQYVVNGEEYYEAKKPFEFVPFFQLKIKIVSLKCGSMHSVVLDENGDLYSWGNNDSGQLGR